MEYIPSLNISTPIINKPCFNNKSKENSDLYANMIKKADESSVNFNIWGRESADEAEKLYEEVISLDPNNKKAYLSLSYFLIQRGRKKESEEICKNWIAHDNQSPLAHYIYALILEKNNKRVLADKEYNIASCLKPDDLHIKTYKEYNLNECPELNSGKKNLSDQAKMEKIKKATELISQDTRSENDFEGFNNIQGFENKHKILQDWKSIQRIATEANIIFVDFEKENQYSIHNKLKKYLPAVMNHIAKILDLPFINLEDLNKYESPRSKYSRHSKYKNNIEINERLKYAPPEVLAFYIIHEASYMHENSKGDDDKNIEPKLNANLQGLLFWNKQKSNYTKNKILENINIDNIKEYNFIKELKKKNNSKLEHLELDYRLDLFKKNKFKEKLEEDTEREKNYQKTYNLKATVNGIATGFLIGIALYKFLPKSITNRLLKYVKQLN